METIEELKEQRKALENRDLVIKQEITILRDEHLEVINKLISITDKILKGVQND